MKIFFANMNSVSSRKINEVIGGRRTKLRVVILLDLFGLPVNFC